MSKSLVWSWSRGTGGRLPKISSKVSRGEVQELEPINCVGVTRCLTVNLHFLLPSFNRGFSCSRLKQGV